MSRKVGLTPLSLSSLSSSPALPMNSINRIFFLLTFLLPQADAFARSIALNRRHTIAKALAAEAAKQRKRKTNVQWIACSSTTEVTRAIQKYVQEGDTVAELGSQLRESSKTLCESIGPAGKAVLVDIERKFPNEKKEQQRTLAMRLEGDENGFYSDRATFIEIRSFDFWRDALFFRHGRHHYNVLVVDISTVAGNDLDLTCISLVREFIALNHGSGEADNKCRAVIVKSGSLQNLARRLHHAQRVIDGTESTDRRGCSTSIVGAVGVKQYRETIPFVVRRGDMCVEVGCHLGTTTTLIDDAAKNGGGGCLGVDVGSNIIKSATKKYPHLLFEVGDGFNTGSLARMRERTFGQCTSANGADNSRVYDCVYVDIGGLSGSEGLLEAVSLLSSITNSLNPRCIVIKSLCIRRLASNLVAFSDVWKHDVLLRQE